MFGFFQTAFYFGYMAFFCFALGCMCGKQNSHTCLNLPLHVKFV